ncbi:hypothetical protein [Halovivax limisalsi]|uniref:hypothetical protein n=1 Tax=Halovivax limisalsi TaxID=1453760 RepID=UPI001FFC57E7|nr:hypothetical protein [Halovivax limisalsi]
MSDGSNADGRIAEPTRRRVLAATSGALALRSGPIGAAADGERAETAGEQGARMPDGIRPFEPCPDATIGPSHVSCASATTDGCADDHPESVRLRSAVEATLADRYPTVGHLADDGFRPYFDVFDRDADGWSHWLHPDYVGDDSILDPERPESVLVDNHSWRAIGVMFIATREGDPVDPPAVYGDEDAAADRCAPWHAHVGLPARKAWWYYRTVHGDGRVLSLPCETPCVMHVWTVDHPDGVHAHDAPPREYREEPVADETGLDTAAEPGVDLLGPATLPEEIVPDWVASIRT